MSFFRKYCKITFSGRIKIVNGRSKLKKQLVIGSLIEKAKII